MGFGGAWVSIRCVQGWSRLARVSVGLVLVKGGITIGLGWLRNAILLV